MQVAEKIMALRKIAAINDFTTENGRRFVGRFSV